MFESRRRNSNKSFDEKDYFTIEALESGDITWRYMYREDPLHYSKNDGSWSSSSDNSGVTVVSGDKIRFYTKRTQSRQELSFAGSAKFNVYGNVMSLVHGDDFVGNNALFSYAFEELFTDSKVVDASNLILPATTLTSYCYNAMFAYCTKLTSAPELPATILANSCYRYMFNDCTSLVTAPELPATILDYSCYEGMFINCTSLTTPPELPATILANSCYRYMFYGCTSLVTAPELPVTTLATECYTGMFINCTSLTTPPELPATMLTLACYSSMFYGCVSLNHITMLATDISAGYCLTDWVGGVSSTGTFVKHPYMTTLPSGASGIPEGWTVIDASV